MKRREKGEAARSLADDFEGRIVWSSADGRASYSLSTLPDDIVTRLEKMRAIKQRPRGCLRSR